MMATERRKHTKRILKKDIFDELVNDDSVSQNLSDELKDILEDEQKQEESFDLNAVVEYYHKCLLNSEKALNYLKELRLKNPENISRFKIGYSDGGIKDKLSKRQVGYLIEKGILREAPAPLQDAGQAEQEVFSDCVVFPVFNSDHLTSGSDREQEKVIALYGINIDTKEKAKPVYFDSYIPLFNEKASKVYDQIILTSSIIDCLSLIELGIENVIALNDVADFTEGQINTLRENRVKTIIFAFDDELESQRALDFLSTLFINEGFRIKVVLPPKPQSSWNEALQNGIYKAEVLSMIDEAELLKSAEPKETFKVKKDNFKYVFTIGDLNYTVTGVKDIFVSNLRINVKAEYQGEWFPDNLDLYSARSRSAFSSNISQKFDVEATRIEKDLLKILEYLEKERDKLLTGKEEKEEELTEEERQIGLSFLRSPDLFAQIVKDLETLGYVGENLNKQLLYICASSRKLDDPISILIISQSASGKSMLVDTVRMLMPESDVIAITSLSDQALNYIPDGGLMHKFLILGEAVHSEVIEHQIREMLSGKELTRLVTTKDDKTGQLISKQVKTKVIVASVMSTTNYRINPENASRFFLINADESREQTRKIHEAQRNKYSLERYYEKKERIPEIIKKHKSAQRLLRNIIIVNPFAKYLDFPDATMRTRRDNERFLDLIAGVCFLRQYQKEIKKSPVSSLEKGIKEDYVEFIECDLADYEIAYSIMVNGVLSSTMCDLPKSAEELYESLRELAKELSKERGVNVNETTFTQREIRENTGFGQTWIKINLKMLVDYEYIELARGGSQRTKGFYRLKEDESISKLNLNMIPTPEYMSKKL